MTWDRVGTVCAFFLLLLPICAVVSDALSNRIVFLLQEAPNPATQTVRVQAMLPVELTLYGNVNGLNKGEALQCQIREEKSKDAQGKEIVVSRYLECNDQRTFRLVKIEFATQ